MTTKTPAIAGEIADEADSTGKPVPAVEEILTPSSHSLTTLRMTCGDGFVSSINWGTSNPYSLIPNPSEATTQATSNRQPMYRLYNKWTGEHHYTSKTSERDVLIKAKWTYEGIGWFAPTSSSTPVYRLYNKYAPGGEHHYTKSASERDNLVKKGWTYEGTGWYSVDEKETNKTPVYRQYNPNAFSCNHNYTIKTQEKSTLINAGWKDEGVGWYGYSALEIDFTKAKVDTSTKTYNGTQFKPSATVTGLTAGADYTVIYGANKNAGTGTITIKGKGNYSGSKTYTFKINKATPVCKAPTSLTGYVGDKLSSIDIASETVAGNTPGKFAWDDGTQTLDDVAEYNFSTTFTPTDTKNYETVKNISVKVRTTSGFWLGTKNAGEGFVDEVYFAQSDSNYVSGKDISSDMKVLHDSTNSNYATVKAKWDKYYDDDKVRLYTTYEGGEKETAYDGTTSEKNKYVEFRILEVSGSVGHKLHDGTTSDGSAVTFMATHVLPTAYKMNSADKNVGGWGASQLRKDMNVVNGKAGGIYAKFSSKFVSQVKSVTKEYNTGNMAEQTATPSTIDCKFWIPSYTELVSSTDSDYASWLPKLEGSQYAWFAKNYTYAARGNSFLAFKTRGGVTPGSCTDQSCYWWERSTSVLGTISFGNVDSDGNPNGSYSADSRAGVAPAFAF